VSNQSRKHRRERAAAREAEQKAKTQARSAPEGFKATTFDKVMTEWAIPITPPPGQTDLEITFDGQKITPQRQPSAGMLRTLAELVANKADPIRIRAVLEEILGMPIPPNANIEIANKEQPPRRKPDYSYSYREMFEGLDFDALERRITREAREREAQNLPQNLPGDCTVDYWASPPEPRQIPRREPQRGQGFDSAPQTVQLVDALADAVNYMDGAPEGSRRDAISKVIDAAIEVCKAVGGASPDMKGELERQLAQGERTEAELQAQLERKPPPSSESVPEEVTQLLRNHTETIQHLTKQLAELRSAARDALNTIERSFYSTVTRDTWQMIITSLRGRV
jgi:hypothetical protein